MAAKIEGSDAILLALGKRAAKARSDARVKFVVGYEAPYAVYVHENLEARHPNGGQAKYLEIPARVHRREIADTIAKAMKSGASLGSAMALGGIRLLRLSQQLVPVDTGFLKDSGFARVENE